MEKKSNFNKFLTLFENDFCRSLKIVLSIIFGFFIGHLITAWVGISNIENRIDNLLRNNSLVEVLNTSEKIGFYDLYTNNGISFIMLLSILVVILYTLLVWNREWMGSSKSIYTLLSLPIKKSYIIFSKVFTMIIFVGFTLLVQILTLFIDKKLMVWTIDERLYLDQSVLGTLSTSYYRSKWFNLISRDIFVSIVTVIALILLLGLIVLLFRSFKTKGLILGVCLLGLYIGLYIEVGIYFHLYWDEYFIFKLNFSLITSILAFMYSRYLLENKVGV